MGERRKFQDSIENRVASRVAGAEKETSSFANQHEQRGAGG
jgi:hypothetical protein